MIHFLKIASLLSLIILSLEPHLSALRQGLGGVAGVGGETRNPETNACEIKTPCLCNVV